MVGDEAEWSRMSPKIRASWRETARRGFDVVGKYIQGLEAERTRLRLLLRQIAGELNRLGMPTARDGQWPYVQVLNLIKRLEV